MALDKREYEKLDEIVAGNEIDPEEIEIRKQEFPHFTLLAHLGYCKSMKYICEQKDESVPLSLEQEIKEARELAYDFAWAATQGKTSDKLVIQNLEEGFCVSIDYLSEMFAERFAEDAIQKDEENGDRIIKQGKEQGTERLSFYSAMVHPGMRKFIRMIFIKYISKDKKLTGFKDDLDIAKRLSSLISNLGKDTDYVQKTEDAMNAYFDSDHVNEMRKKYGIQDDNHQKPS